MNLFSASIDRRHFITASAAIVTFGFTRVVAADDAKKHAKPFMQFGHFKLNMEKEAEAIEALKDICKGVEGSEPDVLAYLCHRSTKHPEEIVLFEVFKDEEASKADHKSASAMKLREGVLTQSLFQAPLAFTGVYKIAGFTRFPPTDDATSSPKPITQIAKFKMNKDKEPEAIKALEEMCKAVEESEPGVLAYLCHRMPEEIVFFEVYKDDEALKAHAKTVHMGKLRAAFLKLFRPPLELTRLDRIAGFVR